MTAPSRRTFLQGTAGAAVGIALHSNLAHGRPPSFGRTIQVGVIGCGRQGRTLLGELGKFDDVQVGALCDVYDSRLRSAARRAREAKPFEKYEDLLATDVQAVLIATPTHLHKDIAIAALKAGKHVYCEAPLAHTIDDAKAIAAAAREAEGVQFQTGLLGRANPVYSLARSFVRAGSMRDVVSLRGQFSRKTSWRFPTSDPAWEQRVNWRLDPDISIGLAGELGTQQFDVYSWFLNRYPVEVRGHGDVRLHKDGRKVADTVHCELVYDDGLRLLWEGTLANSYERTFELMRGSMSTFKLAWTHGWMFKEADAPTQGWEVYANRQQFHNDEGITLIADATQLASQGKLKEGVGLPHPPEYYGMETFLKAIAGGDSVAASAEEGLRATVLGICADEAVKTGKTVAITEDHFKVG